MRARALCRVHPPVRIGNCEAPYQQHPVERDLEPAELAQAELVPEVTPRTWKNVWFGVSGIAEPSSGSWVLCQLFGNFRERRRKSLRRGPRAFWLSKWRR